MAVQTIEALTNSIHAFAKTEIRKIVKQYIVELRKYRGDTYMVDLTIHIDEPEITLAIRENATSAWPQPIIFQDYIDNLKKIKTDQELEAHILASIQDFDEEGECKYYTYLDALFDMFKQAFMPEY